MQLKKYSCLLLVCVIVFSCLSVPAVAVDTEKQITEVSDRRATGHFDFKIPGNTIMEAGNSFPMEYGETITITASYSPANASMDFGLIDFDGGFYPIRASGGSFKQTIRIDQRGNYTFAVRNNSSYEVSVSGFVNY